MRLSDILSSDRVVVARQTDGPRNKAEAISRLSTLLARSADAVEAPLIEKVLIDREQVQSTGIGDGVAIPHGSLENLSQQTAAVLLCPEGVDFDSIDARPAKIIVAVLGPKRATGEHLRMLARISRLLRDGAFRDRLLNSADGPFAYQVISTEEESRP
jgi:PTS system nitrogen regulatory IIA component